jgi:tellurite resistance protein TehA-like permease
MKRPFRFSVATTLIITTAIAIGSAIAGRYPSPVAGILFWTSLLAIYSFALIAMTQFARQHRRLVALAAAILGASLIGRAWWISSAVTFQYQSMVQSLEVGGVLGLVFATLIYAGSRGEVQNKNQGATPTDGVL